MAIDGNSNTGWQSNNQGVGAWIRFNLGKFFKITKMLITHLTDNGSGNYKDIHLVMSNGKKVQRRLNNNKEEANVIVFPANLSPTNSVEIVVNSRYVQRYNGFSEIDIFGCNTKGIQI